MKAEERGFVQGVCVVLALLHRYDMGVNELIPQLGITKERMKIANVDEYDSSALIECAAEWELWND